MNLTNLHLKFFLLLLGCYFTSNIQSQVTIGTSAPPTFGALLDLKSQQTGTVANVDDDSNITSTNGGLLLPRVKLTSFASLEEVVVGGNSLSDQEKLKLAGLMVYNISQIPNTFYLGVYVWNGTTWTYLVDSKISSPMNVLEQPKAFTFYEKGTETAEALEFKIHPPKAADGTMGTVTYKWYEIKTRNLNAVVGEQIIGATASSYTPNPVIKGSTIKSANTGFYRYYCEAKGSDGSLVRSNIVEIAVGCGAKNNQGEWISFMCFNLGADNSNSTIAYQRNYILTDTNDAAKVHTYQTGEENLYGSLFQWGRIPDGHELRLAGNPNIQPYGGITTSDIATGLRCNTSNGNPSGDFYPTDQVKEGTVWDGKYIYQTIAPDYNWNPISVQVTLDKLWTPVGFRPNDPCMRYQDDGTYLASWHTTDNGGVNGVPNANGSCAVSNTGWRIPTQTEWGEVFRSSTLSGVPTVATANTWTWYTGPGNNNGYEIKPDGETTTLLLPAVGYRTRVNGKLYSSGEIGYYWSSDTSGTDAYLLIFNRNSIVPASRQPRSMGFALRCIKQ